MNILFFITKLEVGGCQINAISLAKALTKRGHHVIFFSQSGPLCNLLKEANIAHHPINYDVRHPSIGLMKEMARVAKRHKIDIIQAFDSLPLMEAYGSQFWHNCPVFGMITAQRIPPFFIPKKRAIAMVNPDIRNTYITQLGFPRENIKLIAERLDCDFYRPKDKIEASFYENHRLNPKIPIVSIISRVDEGKLATVFLFINTAYYWKKNFGDDKPVQFVITGSGPAFKKLTMKVAELMLSDTVICTGEILDIPSLMNASSIVLGMASTCQQGLATGTPVIVLGDNGYSAIVDEQSFPFLAEMHFNVHRIAISQPEHRLSEHIYKVLTDKDYSSQLKQFGRSVALKNFTSKVGAKKLEEIYLKLVENHINRLQGLSYKLEWFHFSASYICMLMVRKISFFFRKVQQFRLSNHFLIFK